MILVGTHADKANCPKNARGEYVSPVASSIFAKVQQKFQYDFDIVERVFVMDAQVAMSTDIKALKHQMYNMRGNILKVRGIIYLALPLVKVVLHFVESAVV